MEEECFKHFVTVMGEVCSGREEVIGCEATSGRLAQ